VVFVDVFMDIRQRFPDGNFDFEHVSVVYSKGLGKATHRVPNRGEHPGIAVKPAT
jgi:hypothetical protein